MYIIISIACKVSLRKLFLVSYNRGVNGFDCVILKWSKYIRFDFSEGQKNNITTRWYKNSVKLSFIWMSWFGVQINEYKSNWLKKQKAKTQWKTYVLVREVFVQNVIGYP